jgi:PleD family two-component response regulator
MGQRAQIKFIDDHNREVWFFTHWQAKELEKMVIDTMVKYNWYHEFPECLAHIIYIKMLDGYATETTGFGIGFRQRADVYRVVTIDCSKQIVTFFTGRKKSFSEFKPESIESIIQSCCAYK